MKQVARLLIMTPVFLLFVIRAEAQAKNIVIATSSVVLTNTPIWVGIEKKFFEESGLSFAHASVVGLSVAGPVHTPSPSGRGPG